MKVKVKWENIEEVLIGRKVFYPPYAVVELEAEPVEEECEHPVDCKSCEDKQNKLLNQMINERLGQIGKSEKITPLHYYSTGNVYDDNMENINEEFDNIYRLIREMKG